MGKSLIPVLVMRLELGNGVGQHVSRYGVEVDGRDFNVRLVSYGQGPVYGEYEIIARYSYDNGNPLGAIGQACQMAYLRHSAANV